MISRSGGRLTEKDFIMDVDLQDIDTIASDLAKIGESHAAEQRGEAVDPDAKNIMPQKQMVYCLHPEWLHHSITKSLEKLSIETLDCVYLDNPFENLLIGGDMEKVEAQIEAAIQFLEEMVQENKIRAYGILTH